MKMINYYLSFNLLLLLCIGQVQAQMANGQPKFVGNIMRDEIPSTYDTYWNQVTPENSGKWGVVESTRDVMDWTLLDMAYNYAQQNNMPFKQHTLVWGAQAPDWVGALPAAEQAAEIEEWIQLYAQRYPNTEMIDVVNEPLHVIPDFKDAIGGDGATGWDWVIWSFEKARLYNPNAILILNDYSILGNRKNTSNYIKIINLLKDRGLIDGIGCQAHGLEYAQNSAISTTLNSLAATGVPIYISELELDFENDSDQLNRFQSLWPLLYEHPAVVGVTLWGYELGKHWKPNGYLLGLKENYGTWTLSTTFQDYVTTGSGNIQAHFINDAAGNDVVIDYAILDGVTYQAEDMAVNTGVYQNGSCGGSYSEQLDCSGYIQFPAAAQDIVIRARGVSGNEIMEVNLTDPTSERSALTWLRTDYFNGGTSPNAPTVNITSPSNGQSFTEGTLITINANASDADGSVVGVEFFVNGVSIGTDNTSPYEMNWSVVLGSSSITAEATDNDNLSSTSSAVTVTGTSTSGSGTIVFVESIATGVIGVGQGNKKGTATISVTDDLGNPVSFATISGTFSGTFNEPASGTTQGDGTLYLETSGQAKGAIIVDFCVDDVVHSNLVYDQSQNVITCTGSGSRQATDGFISENANQVFDVYPTLVKDGFVNISLPVNEKFVNAHVLDLSGKLHLKLDVMNNDRLSLKGLNNSIYLLKIQTDKGIYVKRLSVDQSNK